MSRHVSAFITACAGAICAVAVLSAQAAFAQSAAVCIASAIDGSATAFARGVDPIPVQPGLGLGRNAVVRTGETGRVTLTCEGGLTVMLGPQTELVVSGVLQGGTRPLGLRLLDGVAGFLFNRDGNGGVQITTPSAVAAVRSTEWAMQVERGASAIFSRDGRVFVFAEAAAAPLELNPGEGVDVTAAGLPGEVLVWGPERREAISALLGPMW